MACAAPPSPVPVPSLPARRRTTAAYSPPSSRLSRRSWLPSGNAPRARLAAGASNVEPAEESLPAAPPGPSAALPQPNTRSVRVTRALQLLNYLYLRFPRFSNSPIAFVLFPNDIHIYICSGAAPGIGRVTTFAISMLERLALHWF